MKKLLFILSILFSLQATFAFDFSDIQEKSRFCTEKGGENYNYNQTNDTCLSVYKNGSTHSQDFKTFYCKHTGTSWLPYSYITEKCIEFGDIFDNSYYFDHKTPKYLELINYDDEKGVSIQMQKKLSIVYKKFIETTENQSLDYTKRLEKKVANYIDRFIQKTKNENNKYAFLLLKYEIENIYLQKKFGCKGKYCNQNTTSSYNEKYLKQLFFDNEKKLLLEYGEPATFGCYNGKTILKEGKKETVIIDDTKYNEYYSLCSVDAQIVDDDNVFLVVCIGGGAGSGECTSLVFNLELSTKKLSFLGNWYYIPSSGLNLYTLKQYKETQEGYQKTRINDVTKNLKKNKNSEEYKREYELLVKMSEEHKKIRAYFKQNHHIDIPYIEGDKLIELLPNKK